ncbi:Protein of unknown function [Bacillus mycoides]|uniref:Uncharacterized protein n=1 Tax=Bacillus mycoides TaxID=1405 RepID=A0A1C4G3M6_BACMY|nr:Protein of unknown function [Bacillus mycoides]SCC62351.1 Protein of unknown function [Bacillus mycoides]
MMNKKNGGIAKNEKYFKGIFMLIIL